MRSKCEFYDGKMKVARGSGLISVENIHILTGQMSKTLGNMKVSGLAAELPKLLYISTFSNQDSRPPGFAVTHECSVPPPCTPLIKNLTPQDTYVIEYLSVIDDIV